MRVTVYNLYSRDEQVLDGDQGQLYVQLRNLFPIQAAEAKDAKLDDLVDHLNYSLQGYEITIDMPEGLFLSEGPPELDKSLKECSFDYIDQIGLGARIDQTISAIQWLDPTVQEQESGVLREKLDEDQDLEANVLGVLGKAEGEARTIRGIAKFQNIHPTPVRPPVSIKAGVPSAEPTVEAIKRAFGANRVQTISLGGKHSFGSMLAHDPESGQRWLLKSGAGSQSPAMGAREEQASQARREAAFWHISRLLGLDTYVPRAEVVVMDGHDYAAIDFLNWSWRNLDKDRRIEPAVVTQALEGYRRRGILHRWAVLDWITGQTDRHGANLMISQSGFIKLIDAGSAFAGPSFSPGTDRKSFVPFYLRSNVHGWSRLPPESKLMGMASISHEHDRALRNWTKDLDSERLRDILQKDGLIPEPTIARLKQLQDLSTNQPFYLQLNKLWIGLPP